MGAVLSVPVGPPDEVRLLTGYGGSVPEAGSSEVVAEIGAVPLLLGKYPLLIGPTAEVKL